MIIYSYVCNSYSCENKVLKKSDFKGSEPMTSAINWKLVMSQLWAHNIPVDGEDKLRNNNIWAASERLGVGPKHIQFQSIDF